MRIFRLGLKIKFSLSIIHIFILFESYCYKLQLSEHLQFLQIENKLEDQGFDMKTPVFCNLETVASVASLKDQTNGAKGMKMQQTNKKNHTHTLSIGMKAKILINHIKHLQFDQRTRKLIYEVCPFAIWSLPQSIFYFFVKLSKKENQN